MQPAVQERQSEPGSGIGIIAKAVSLIRRHAGDRHPVPQLSAAARTCLLAHPWDSGLETLEACIERALVLCESDVIEPRHLALSPANASDSESRETAAILTSLQAAHGKRGKAAVSLGIAPRTLRVKLADLRARGVAVPGCGVGEAGVPHG